MPEGDLIGVANYLAEVYLDKATKPNMPGANKDVNDFASSLANLVQDQDKAWANIVSACCLL